MWKAWCTCEVAVAVEVAIVWMLVFFFHVLVAVALLPILTRDDSKRRFQAQHIVAMLEQCCNHSKQCRSSVVVMLCCTKNRRCESSWQGGTKQTPQGWVGVTNPRHVVCVCLGETLASSPSGSQWSFANVRKDIEIPLVWLTTKKLWKVEPRPHRWELSALTTATPVLHKGELVKSLRNQCE